MKPFGKFFGQINDENFNEIYQSVCIGYVEDFWELFIKFKSFKKVSGQMLANYINDPETIHEIVREKSVRYLLGESPLYRCANGVWIGD